MEVTSEKSQCTTSFGGCSIYMCLPGHVLAKMNTKIFGTVHRFKNMSVHGVLAALSIPWVRANMNDLTLFWVKAHLPIFFPLLQTVKIFLEGLCIFIRLDEFVQEPIIRK